MRLGEAFERGQFEIAEITMRENVGQNIVTVLVPCACGRTRVAAENYLELWKWRIAGEIFVGEDVELGWVIHSEQTHIIEINNFLQWFHEPEAEDRVPHFSPILGEVGIIFF